MLDNEPTDDTTTEGLTPSPADAPPEAPSDPPPVKRTTRTRKKSASRAQAAPSAEALPGLDASAETGPDPAVPAPAEDDAEPAAAKPAKKTTKKAAAKKSAAKKAAAKKSAAKKTTAKKAAAKKTTAKKAAATKAVEATDESAEPTPEPTPEPADEAAPATEPLFQAPTASAATPVAPVAPVEEDEAETEPAATSEAPGASTDSGDISDRGNDGDNDGEDDGDDAEGSSAGRRRRRRRGGRRRRKGGGDGEARSDSSDDASGEQDDDASSGAAGGSGSTSEGSGDAETDGASEGRGSTRRSGRGSGKGSGNGPSKDSGDDGGRGDDEQGSGVTSKRRRRRRRAGDADTSGDDDSGQTVTKVRSRRSAEDEITAVSGSTRLEAKKQRRREGREAGRRRAPIVSEAEFLARRESVDRSMVVRQRDDLTQIAVLEDDVLVEHYVARESQTSLIGNVYLGRVQNVLPSMEAAFVDIGKGRNAVIYAGEVNWSALGHTEGQPRKIESVLSSGQSILVQVTKDPIGHKGARLTSQISLAGRFLVYVPDGTTSGISRKLPDTERARLKAQLKEIVPDGAGVIVRTAAEGATDEQLTRDVERLTARWADIEAKAKGGAPKLLYGEPDLTLKVVRDLFTEDFSELLIEGEAAWDTVRGYVSHVAPDLEDRLTRFEIGENGKDSFAIKRIDEQIAKGLDRKVWLPSGGSLIFDRTEAMVVVDVNTGKFTGSGGNLEETVTKNNLEAAEELVRQLRLRDLGGIIVVDFIDMVLESNRDLVLRRLVECLGRDRTRHQVAEVSSLGLVQMTRKRIGTGLLESFSESCDHCSGVGYTTVDIPVEPGDDDSGGRGRRRGGKGRGRGNGNGGNGNGRNGNGGNGDAETPPRPTPSPSYVAAVAKPENADRPPLDEQVEPDEPGAATTPDVAPEQVPDATPDPEPADPSLTTEPEPVSEPVPEPTPEPVDTAPRTVTRTTRRRSAARPAGSPAGAAAAVVVTATEPAAPEAVATEVAAPPPPPTVVTRTRGRGGRRTPAAEPDPGPDTGGGQ